MPCEILSSSIVIGHWGGSSKFYRATFSDCLDPAKDIVVPPVTPIQHDQDKYREKLQKALLLADSRQNLTRDGPTLLFSGGVFSFGASQDNTRVTGRDSASKRLKWEKRAERDRCAKPQSVCRGVYSMGVRQAVWRQGLQREPDMRLVSAGIPDYMSAVPRAHFCLHTEGNSWGTRLIDYMAMECIPLIVNDGMVFPFADVVPYANFSLHMSKRQIPQIAGRLRGMPHGDREQLRRGLRRYKRAFIWWRPEGLAYEYTMAALGERILSLGQGASTMATEERGTRVSRCLRCMERYSRDDRRDCQDV